MPRPALALLAALSLLLALPVAGASAKRRHGPRVAKLNVRWKASKRRPKAVRHRPHATVGLGSVGIGVGDDDPANDPKPVATVSAIDGDLVTLALAGGGSVAAHVDADTDYNCADDGPAADDDPTAGDPGPDFRSACTVQVGAAVYSYDVDDTGYALPDGTAAPLFDELDLTGA